jgi:hypothetical protein
VTMINRETIRDAVVSGLVTATTGTGKPVSGVYGYQKGRLDGESPVILVLSGGIQRIPAGLGSQKYNNVIELELHLLVYDGADNPLSEAEREDKVDAIELACAGYFATNQNTATWRACFYTPDPTQITNVTYLDGNPYRLEIVKVRLEVQDS